MCQIARRGKYCRIAKTKTSNPDRFQKLDKYKIWLSLATVYASLDCCSVSVTFVNTVFYTVFDFCHCENMANSHVDLLVRLSSCFLCDEKKRTRLFPCGHHFCGSCIEKHRSVYDGRPRSDVCVKCEQDGVAVLSKDVVDNHPGYHYLLHCANKTCQCCGKEPLKEHCEHYCESCGFLGTNCIQSHQLSMQFAQHKVNRAEHNRVYCREHEQNKFLFCNDCSKLICDSCVATGTHAGHVISAMNSYLAINQTLRLASLRDALRSQLNLCIIFLTMSQTYRNRIESECRAALEALEASKQTYLDEIEDRMAELRLRLCQFAQKQEIRVTALTESVAP